MPALPPSYWEKGNGGLSAICEGIVPAANAETQPLLFRSKRIAAMGFPGNILILLLFSVNGIDDARSF
jgi:hypothetical protein